MKFAVAHIIWENWIKDMRDINNRLALLRNMSEQISELDSRVDLLVLPAGFLMTKKVNDCDTAAKSLVRSLPEKHPAIAFGVDCRRAISDNDKKSSKTPPFFGYVVSKDKEKIIWNLRQQGTDNMSLVDVDGLKLENNNLSFNRYFSVNGKKMTLVICGEMTSRVKGIKGRPRLSEFLMQKGEADLAVVIAHADRLLKPIPRSWFPAMKAVGKPCVLSEHLWYGYINHGLYCLNSKEGPDYSFGLTKPQFIRTEDYYLKIYDLP